MSTEHTTVAYPDNIAMRCLLETMRDNPGTVSSSAAVGAAAWALGRIKHLEDRLNPPLRLCDIDFVDAYHCRSKACRESGTCTGATNNEQ